MPSPPSLIVSPVPSRDAPPSGTWFPYRNGGDFDANLGMILIILFAALLAALALNAAIRCYFRRSSRDPSSAATGKPAVAPPVLPTLAFSAEMKTAGGEAECAICLSEFVDGEAVRVLPRCKHAFHAKCIEGWLASRLTCPTCRTTILTLSSEKNPAPPEVLPEP